jgi:hypothetical protein
MNWRLWLIYSDLIDCTRNEQQTEKCHECMNMGKVKRLEI